MSQLPRRLFIVDQSLLQPGGHYFEYSTGIGIGAVACGFEPVILANRALTSHPVSALPDGIELLPTFTHRWHEGAYEGEGRYGPGHLGQELFAVLERYHAAPGDRVLVHTLGWHQAAQIFDRLLATPRSRQDSLPPLAILLRYDPAELDLNMLAVFRDRLKRIAAARLLSDKLFLYSDTDRLTEALSKLFDFPVVTLPIPFNQQVLFDALAASPAKGRSGPLTVTYVGDARDEKGYPLLPAAVAALWRDYVLPGRVRFVLQSNFNMPGGERLAGPARAELERYSAPQVTLIRDPLETRAYYDLIAAADILVIPYDPTRYELRSSGILVEALTAGKVLVTSKGSWMETKVDRSHSVLFEPGQLVPALVEAIETYEELSAGARKIAQRWHTDSSPRNFVGYLDRSMSRPPSAGLTGPSVLFVIDAECILLRNGASRVALNQLGFLFRSGYRVTGLFVSTAADTPQTLFALRRAVERELASLPFYDLHVAGYAPQADGELSDQIYQLARFAGEHSIERDLAGRLGIAVPDLLKQRLADRKPDLVLLNYVFNLPVLDALLLAGVPILCEMHDIQSHQRAIYGQREVDHADLALETALLDRCDHIIALNEREAEWVRQRLPQKPYSYIPITAPVQPARADALLDADTLTQLVARCGCPLLDPGMPAYDPALAKRLDRFAEADLLVVSSAHLANVSGLRWFFDEVFFPYLAGAGTTVLVAGTIADAGGWPDHPNIAFTGLVEHLAPLYAAAKIVILPVIQGAGSPVKTIEALASAKPVVATTVALRGLGEPARRLKPADSPELFGRQIAALLGDPAARFAAGRQALEISEQTMSGADYDRRLDRAIRQLIDPQVPLPAPPERPVASDELVEWKAVLGVVNRAVRALTSDGAIDADGLARLHALLSGPDADGCRALFERRLRGCAEPIALSAAEKILALATKNNGWRHPNGQRQPTGYGRLRFLSGSRLSRQLLLRNGAQYEVEVTTSGSVVSTDFFAILLNGTPLARRETRAHGDWTIHIFPVQMVGEDKAPAACEITLDTLQEFVLEDLQLRRTVDLGAESGLIGGSKVGSLALPLLGSPDLTLRLTVTKSWESAAACFSASLGDMPLRRVLERNVLGATVVEFMSQEFPKTSALRLALPAGVDWPSGSLGFGSVEIAESLLPVTSDGASARAEALQAGRLSLESFVDQISPDGDVLGWARCREIPRLRLRVLAMAGDTVLASTLAGSFRQDLLAAGKGDGYCFFALPVGRESFEAHRDRIRFFLADGQNIVAEMPIPIGAQS